MKKLLFLLAITLAIGGCVTIEQFPHTDIIIYTMTPLGPMPIEIPKGMLSPKHEGGSWMTKEDFYKEEPEEKGDPI